MKFTRILAFILALVMVAMPLASCAAEEGAKGESFFTTALNSVKTFFVGDEDHDNFFVTTFYRVKSLFTDEEIEELSDGEEAVTLDMITRGRTEYVIVRDYKASNKILEAVNGLVASIKVNIGADVAVKECYNDLENEPSDVVTKYEILVGVTNRKESEKALEGLRSKDYTISVHGTKLVIGGSGEEGTVAAVAKFINDVVVLQGNRFSVSQGDLQNLSYSSANNIYSDGTYSYSSAMMLGARIDSFGIIHPKNSEYSEEYKKFANALSAHISSETGYDLAVYKDTRAWCDYEILIGDTIRTDEDEVGPLGNDEYYIKLSKTEVTYEDGTTHPGGKLIICFGKNAYEAAMNAFTQEIMPVVGDPVPFALEDGFVLTNRA